MEGAFYKQHVSEATYRVAELIQIIQEILHRLALRQDREKLRYSAGSDSDFSRTGGSRCSLSSNRKQSCVVLREALIYTEACLHVNAGEFFTAPMLLVCNYCKPRQEAAAGDEVHSCIPARPPRDVKINAAAEQISS